MSQLSLPMYTPRDRGRLNALRNIVAAISDELRQQESVATGIVQFATAEFPTILRQYSPFDIRPANDTTALASPYPFELFDLVQAANRPDVFDSVAELIRHVDLAGLASPLSGNVELIGIDESQVDTPLSQGTLSFLKSVAFRMYRYPNGTLDEEVGPLLTQMRMQLGDGESFEGESALLSYIRNSYTAYVSALSSLSFGRRPFIVLHGPLVRAIGAFSNLNFSYDTARKLLNVDLPNDGEFVLPSGANTPVTVGDANTTHNLPLAPADAVDGKLNLRSFHNFCFNQCGQMCEHANVFPENSWPKTKGQKRVRERDYPGFCLYFWVLRSLADLCRITQSSVTSVVEDVSRATEATRILFPSLLASDLSIPHLVANSSLREALRALNIQYPSQRDRLFRDAMSTIERLNLTDSNLLSYILAEGQYTAPIQVYRYRPQDVFFDVLRYRAGVDNKFRPILEKLFPGQSTGTHPGYRVLMSYLRTTPLREPVRVEYFDFAHLTAQQATPVIGPIYLLSLPYQEYGLPIILYYTDKLARTPSQLIKTLIEREYFDLILKGRFSDPVSIMRVLGRLNRGYFQ